jgi:hypothetical protein
MTSSPFIFAFSGKIGSGRNYIANNYMFDYFRKLNKNVLFISFAEYLKILCHVKDRILYERLFKTKDEESRRSLHRRGTLERKDNENIFIEVVKCKIRSAIENKTTDIIIITDLRFKNEFSFLKNLGAVLFRINSPDRTYFKIMSENNNDKDKVSIVSSHISEVDLDNYTNQFDHYILNDYQNEDGVYDVINNIMNKFKFN